MSIDVYARMNGQPLEVRNKRDIHDEETQLVLKDQNARDAFARCRGQVLSHGKGVDMGIEVGALYTTRARRWLEMFLGERATWSHKMLWIRFVSIGTWSEVFPVPEEDAWAYWSAREFFATCVGYGYGLDFS